MSEKLYSVEKITVKLRCDSDTGTGFLLSKTMILSTYHIFMDCEDQNSIEVFYNDDWHKAILTDRDEDLDIVLLQIEDSLEDRFFMLEARSLRIGDAWETFGFPAKQDIKGIRIAGEIHQIISNERWDYLLNCKATKADYDYSGLSGAPVVISNKICGIILIQQDDKVGILSIKKAEEFLLKNGIEISLPYDNIEIPISLRKEVSESTPNFAVFQNIDQIIQEQSNWILLYGSPGSGKTTISATYVSDNENIIVIGRYFLKVPQDNISATVRASKRSFIEWIEELIYRTIGTQLPPQKNWEEKERIVPQMINFLSDFLYQSNQIGVIIIDGLDEIIALGEDSLYNFLGLIPFNLPDNIRIIISCTSKNILPSSVKELISTEKEILVEPLDLSLCENYVLQKTKSIKLPFPCIQELARKSEGHPLYLNYLISYVLNTYTSDEDDKAILDWLNEIPIIGGDITKYYNTIWDKICQNKEVLAIITTLSQVRGGVSEDDLILMLGHDLQFSFYTHIQSLLYLLNNSNNEYEIFHTSFKNYLESNITPIILKQVNDKIISFCETNKDKKYSIWNYLYNLSKSTSQEKCIDQCSQDWADRCALFDVNPDLILVDIINSINIAINLGKTTEVIRLLLLSQRIEFRYDSVFAENAFELAEAMIALGKPEAAYNYLVRESTLLTTESESIYFLQLFYENEYTDVAHDLYENIEALIRQIYNKKDGISPQTFLTQLYAQTQLQNEGEVGFDRFSNLISALGKYEQSHSEDEEGYESNLELFKFVRELGMADNCAFYIRRNMYVSVEQRLAAGKYAVNERIIKVMALSLLKVDEQNNMFNYTGKNDSYIKAVDDLITCIKKHNLDYTQEELYILLRVLIENGKDSKVILGLLNQYKIESTNLNLRQENGVDVNFDSIHRYCNIKMFIGYNEKGNSFPQIIYSDSQWEAYSMSLIESIALLKGYICRSVADNTEKPYERLLHIISKIDFSFDVRSKWKRSYHIPESIFPYIYSQIAQQYVDFFPDKIFDFIEHLKNRADSQLSLYTEGFRKALFDITSIFVKHNMFRNETFELLNILENHIMIGVQNRWERTPELIRIVKLYALLDNEDKALSVFQKMLNTSMGPNWYKEDQLHLINRVVCLQRQSSSPYLRNFASLLDLASGEMTFQRYIRDEKEEFIGSLTKLGLVSDAIEYFKFETLPSPEVVIQNAESNPVDMPRKGDGYILGAKNIVEADGILHFLENDNLVSPIIKWALSEIYLVNDDNFRYIDRFAQVHSKLLEDILNFYAEHIDQILDRLAFRILSTELEERDRQEYLSTLKKNTQPNIIIKLQGWLLKRNYSWDIITNEDTDSPSSTITSKKSVFDETCEFYEHHSKNTSRNIVLDRLTKTFRDGRVSFWFNNYSQKHSLLREYLKEFIKNDTEVLNTLRNDITNSGYAKWVVASQLTWLLENVLSEKQAIELHSIIYEHFALLIQPQDDDVEKYDWMTLDKKDSDEVVVSCIVWLLNHPDSATRSKSYDTLLWLGGIVETKAIHCLIEESISNKPMSSTEICSYILKDIQERNSEIIKSVLLSDEGLLNQICSINHLTIYKNYLDISVDLVKTGYSDLYNLLKNKIPKALILEGDVILDDDFLIPIEDEISYLNDEQLLNSTFCLDLKDKIYSSCTPLTPKEFVTSDKYVVRSFPEADSYMGRYHALLRFSLNQAIMKRVSQNNIVDIYNILN